jgi:hypothetical protein
VLLGPDGARIPINGTPCEAFGTSPQATSAINTAAIQAALLVTGNVTLTIPGIYNIDGLVRIPSNTHFHLGDGVTLRLANERNNIILCNKNFDATFTNVTSCTAVTNVVTIVMPTATSYAVEDWISVMGSTSNWINGIWQIITVETTTNTNDTVTYKSYKSPTASPTGIIQVGPVDRNIRLSGGTIDGNKVNQTANGDFSTFHGVMFKHVMNLTIADISVIDVKKFGFWTINCLNSHINRIMFNTASDGFHVGSPNNGVQISDISGYSGDDLLAFTQSMPGNSFNQQGGNITNVQAKGIKSDHGDTSVIKFSSISNFTYGNIEIDGIFGLTRLQPVSMVNDQPGEPYWSAESIILRNIQARSYISSTQVILINHSDATTRNAKINRLIIDGAEISAWSGYFIEQKAGSWIDHLEIRGIYATPAMTGVFAYLNNSAKIGSLLLKDSKFNLETGTTHVIYQPAGATPHTISELTIDNLTVWGYADKDVCQLAGATTKVNVSNVNCSGISRLIAWGSGVAAGSVNLSNVILNNSASILSIGGGGTAMLSNVAAAAMSGAAIVFGSTAANSHTSSLRGVLNAANGLHVSFTAFPPSVFSMAGANLQVDGTKITTGKPGEMFWNTNAAYGTGVGLYVRDAAAFVKIA